MYIGETQNIRRVVRTPKVDMSELETTEAPVEPAIVTEPAAPVEQPVPVRV